MQRISRISEKARFPVFSTVQRIFFRTVVIPTARISISRSPRAASGALLPNEERWDEK